MSYKSDWENNYRKGNFNNRQRNDENEFQNDSRDFVEKDSANGEGDYNAPRRRSNFEQDNFQRPYSNNRQERGGYSRDRAPNRDNFSRSSYGRNEENSDDFFSAKSYADKPRNDRFNPRFDRNDRNDRNDRPRNDRPRGDRFSNDRSSNDRFGNDRFNSDRPRNDRPREDRFNDRQDGSRGNFRNFRSDNDRFGNRGRDSFNNRSDRNDRNDRGRDSFRGDGFQRNDQGGFRQKSYDDRPNNDYKLTNEFNSGRAFSQADFGGGRDRDFDRAPRGGQREGRTSRFRENTSNLFDLDKDILTLLFKRAELLQSVKRDGRVEPGLEKKLRTSWESGATRVTRDPRIARDFFNLLQQIEPIPLVGGMPTYFNLAPNFVPADMQLQAPVCSRQLRMFLALAAASGASSSFFVDLSHNMMACIKAFNQMGGQLWWEGDGRVLSRGGEGLAHHVDKVIPVGEDAFSFYLVLALSLLVPSRLKLVGDGDLRFLNISAIRQFLPTLNARMSTVIPGQDAIPVRTESVGMMPQHIVFTNDLPKDFIISLIVASVVREDVDGACTFTVENHPDAERIVSEVVSVLDELDVPNSAEINGGILSVSLTPCTPAFSDELQIEMDPLLASTLLAVPAFVGGQVILQGALNEADSKCLAFLESAGLAIQNEEMQVIANFTGQKLAKPDFSLAPSYPFALVFAALSTYNGNEEKLPQAPENIDENIVKGFLGQLGIAVNAENELVKIEPETSPWFLPSADWGLALSLAAFMRPNIRITNADMVTASYPTFWKLYNSLPNPSLKVREAAPQVEETPASTARRFIAPVIEKVEEDNFDAEENFEAEEASFEAEEASFENFASDSQVLVDEYDDEYDIEEIKTENEE